MRPCPDGKTNWFTITAFRGLAINVFASIVKGDRVLITGLLRIREWETDSRRGINVEPEAASIGHDFAWGTSTWTRRHMTAPVDETPETASPASDLTAA